MHVKGQGSGSGNVDFWGTSVLERLTFDDGTTPEEHGVVLTFGSGRTSPNLVVPEPSTLLLLSMPALALTVGWWRRRRAA